MRRAGKKSKSLKAAAQPGAAAIAAVAVVLALTACDDKPAPAPAGSGKAAAPAQPSAVPTPVVPSQPMAGAPAAAGELNVANLKIAIPEGWRQVPVGNPMRLAELHAPGDVLVVLSTAQGGVQANLDRWAAQFTGGPPPQVEQRTVSGWPVHIAKASGAYSNMGAPALENHALRGAVIETPAGLVFIKLTGPAPAVEQADAGFEQLIASIRPL